MTKRDVRWTIAGVVAALVVMFGYPRFFAWWNVRTCAHSGGQWNVQQDRCVEPGSGVPPPKDANLPATG